ncbi:MAG: hypothetical protein HQ536_00330 [Parcubacteria group bacterium]|nr:hypothetical protein [Parcubacteria group bacterium]
MKKLVRKLLAEARLKNLTKKLIDDAVNEEPGECHRDMGATIRVTSGKKSAITRWCRIVGRNPNMQWAGMKAAVTRRTGIIAEVETTHNGKVSSLV